MRRATSRTTLAAVPGRARAAWNAYWFGREGRLSIEVVRIALGIGALLTWQRAALPDYASFLAQFPPGAYRPVGILQLLGSDPPPALFFELCKITALIAIVAMTLGLASRASTLLSAIAMLFVAGVHDGFSPSWSHSLPPLLAAHLVFALAPSGRMLSLDALWRRRRGRGGDVSSPAWPVLLVQLFAALPYFNASTWKIRSDLGLGWVFSDNLRHQLLNQFDWAGNPRTAVGDLLMRHEALWQAAAFANLVAQMAPFAACFFVRRPLVRLLLGSFFVVETIALDLVMGLPNYHWLPLAAAFVDWDHFVPRIARRWRRPPEPADPGPVFHRSRAASGLIAAVLAVTLIVMFGPRGLDKRLNTYPISQYRMFAAIRAKRPFSIHQTWDYDTLCFSLDGDRWPEVARGFETQFRKQHSTRSAAEVERILRQALRRMTRLRLRPGAPGTIDLRFCIVQAPAYPAEPELVRNQLGILGRLRGKTFQTLLGAAADDAGRPYLEPRAVGLELPADLRVSYFLDSDPRPRAIEVERRGARLYYTPRESGRHIFTAEIGGERFVIAQARHKTAP